MTSTSDSSFSVAVSFQGQSRTIEATTSSSASAIYDQVLQVCQLEKDISAVKVLYKGKKLDALDTETLVFTKVPTKPPKLLVMASSRQTVQRIQQQKSDPTIRGFEQEQAKEHARRTHHQTQSPWGPTLRQDAKYRFVKIQACNDQDFGHQAGDATPHSFAAQQLLEQMANDPGIVAIMRDRQLVVNSLHEMDPIDDRLMQKKQHGNSALLGYNTNHGLSIHIRLRTFDLKGFLPYEQLIHTLIHELSHNWIGDHDYVFWTNFAHMRVEYLHTHARLAAQGTLVRGQSTAQLAQVGSQCADGMSGIAQAVLTELAQELPQQYQLSVEPLAPGIIQHCRELTQQYAGLEHGQRLGGSTSNSSATSFSAPVHPRLAVLAAAEQRAEAARKQQAQDDAQSRARTTNNGMNEKDKDASTKSP